ncbi:hypothetical protein DRN69_09505 [Candidatus Pacearchaeota archaeon]|mgnify:CR=1 FL=1|nr:MAG: hypothetical protein DRN69_09505 [Candidatus Pacearchaeota archaeon]
MKTKNLIVFSILFLISTSFFIYQHASGISWDFASYVLNAKYLFDDGLYFEWLRAPLPSLMLGSFSIFGWKSSEYLFIIFVSLIHLLASIKLSKNFKFNPILFYSLTLIPAMLNFSFLAGTELLSLALLEFGISYIFEKNNKKAGILSGLFFGLAITARYTNLLFIPLILFHKKAKKILISALFLAVPLIPWMIYNYVQTGNPLMSIGSSLLINISQRSGDFGFFMHSIEFLRYYVLFLVGGIIVSKKNAPFWVMTSFLIISLISFARIPNKEIRYLFNLILPCAYFSYAFFRSFGKKVLVISCMILVILSFGIAFSHPMKLTSISLYENVSNYLDKGCMYMSNMWVPLNYLGYNSEPAPVEFNKEKIPKFIDDGKRIIYFKKMLNSDYFYVENKSFMKSFPVLNETEKYLILGKEDCKEPSLFIENYDVDNCRIFLPNFLKRFC